MIKRAVFIQSSCYLSVSNRQLVIKNKESKTEVERSVEDLGFVVLDHAQISFSMYLIQQFAENNVAVLFCDDKHLPSAMMLPLDTHGTQSQHVQAQVDASEPLKKQLWKQCVKAKIRNQAALLNFIGANGKALEQLAKKVKSGDTANHEAQASRYYWPQLFGRDFLRRRFGKPPNNGLNYGYAVLRAGVARALAGAGLMPTLGIHHHNKYNTFCLADDVMEPYRPFVDMQVWEMWDSGRLSEELQTDHKLELLEVLSSDVRIGSATRPLMNALNETAVSLVKCFKGERKQLTFPLL